ncbi:MAG: leucine-rich repeat domain-containing protein [Clostridiales bacterium]|jgi:hypothetical protein|nr:leucine-rich repeat domain-containing protein [Clostridiales bacterium]
MSSVKEISGLTIKEDVLSSCADNNSIDETVALPEGIERIGEKAMAEFICGTLVMPASLKEIDALAFENASIKEIDFSACKLERIGEKAFGNCRAKATLPDSVTYISSEGVLGLDIGDNAEIRLPMSLGFIGDKALDLSHTVLVRADEGVITKSTNFYSSIVTSLPSDKWVYVYATRNGRLVNKFVISAEICNGKTLPDFIGDSGIDCEIYDKNFGLIKNQLCKKAVAGCRVLYSKNIKNAGDRFFFSYYLKSCINGCQPEEIVKTFGFALNEFMIPEHLEELLEMARESENVVLVAYILDVINRNYGAIGKPLGL